MITMKTLNNIFIIAIILTTVILSCVLLTSCSPEDGSSGIYDGTSSPTASEETENVYSPDNKAGDANSGNNYGYASNSQGNNNDSYTLDAVPPEEQYKSDGNTGSEKNESDVLDYSDDRIWGEIF